MKIISSTLAQHLAGEVTTLATCWQVTRRDGEVQGFTDHARDLEVDGITYKAASGYTRTAIRGTAELAVDNLDVESVFSDDGITEEDLRAGKYDFAEIRMFLVNPRGTAHVQVSVYFSISPTDHAIVAVYTTLDDASEVWDLIPMMEFLLENTADPNRISFLVTGVYKFRVGVRRSGSTDTITSAELSLRKDGVNA